MKLYFIFMSSWLIKHICAQGAMKLPTVGILHKSDVYFLYGNYGRVRLFNMELCSDVTSRNRTVGEALCRSKGYHLGVVGSDGSNVDGSNTVNIRCSAPEINNCSVTLNSANCSQVVYLYCDDHSAVHSSQGPVSNGNDTKTTTTGITKKIIYFDVSFGFVQSGRVRVHGDQICYNTFTSTAGQALCGSKGLIYISHSSTPAYSKYPTADITCTDSYVSSCYLYITAKFCRDVVDIKCTAHTTQSTIQTTTTVMTSKMTIPIYARTIGVSAVQFPYRHGGHVKLNGQEICYTSFTKTAGEALCHSKGLKYSSYTRTFAYNRYRSQLMHCSSPVLSSCYIFQRFCDDVVNLHCTGYSTEPIVTTTSAPTLVRLVNGRFETEGRVELLHDGKWGTICDDDFDNRDGDVICKMLGYRGANRVFGTAYFTNGYGPIWQDNLHCIGNETDIGDCVSNGWGNTDCGHGEDAGVSCDPYSFGHFSSLQRTTVGNPCILTSTPCLNGGTCVVSSNYGYTCQCAQGFGGPYCRNGLARTTPKDACHNNPCQNGGTCYQTSPQDGYHCLCSNGYTGNSCETMDIDPKSIVSVGCLDNAWNITVHLPSLQKKYPDFKPNECYVGIDNANCTGQVNGSYLSFRQDYSECNTKEKNSTEGVEYSSELVCPRHDRLYHFIIREIRLRMNLLCKFFSINSASSSLRDRLVHLQFFSDPSLSHSKNFDSSKVGDKLYVRAFSDVTDRTLKMRLSYCYTTPAIVTDSKMQYFVIRNGCVIDPNAVIFYQSAHETRFSFEYFEFTTSHDSINLYCNATFCQSNDHSPACQPTCHAHVIRRLRGGKDDIDFTDEDDTFQIDIDNKQVTNVKSKTNTDLVPVSVISIIIGVCVIALLVIALTVKMRRNRNILKL